MGTVSWDYHRDGTCFLYVFQLLCISFQRSAVQRACCCTAGGKTGTRRSTRKEGDIDAQTKCNAGYHLYDGDTVCAGVSGAGVSILDGTTNRRILCGNPGAGRRDDVHPHLLNRPASTCKPYAKGLQKWLKISNLSSRNGVLT